MKFWTALLGLTFILFILSACDDGLDEQLLVGKWQAFELLENEAPVDLDLSPVYFEFLADHRYHFQSTLKFSESGRYYTMGHLLYTTDTTANEAIEKAVKIVQLNKDSLSFLMNDQGVGKQLRLIKMASVN